MDDVKTIDTKVSESCEIMSSIQECIVELESVLEAQEMQGKSQEFPSVAQLPPSESAETSQDHVSKARLPKLEHKKFHGNPIHWYPFWESFESAVHKNPNLSSVDKFNYLQSLLTGTAVERLKLRHFRFKGGSKKFQPFHFDGIAFRD